MKYNNLSINNKNMTVGLAWALGVGLAMLLLVLFVSSDKAEAFTGLSSQMSVGSRGNDVTSLQNFLASNSLIYPQGLITGYYGGLTRAAVGQFQLAVGLPNVGVVGPLTLAKINEMIASGRNLDIAAPSISSLNANVSGRTAVISWNTSEVASGKVYYSRDPISMIETSSVMAEPFISGTMMTQSAFSGQKSFTIDNLSSGTYYYVVQATDLSGNLSIQKGSFNVQ